jgi:hypothetical protein
VSLNRYNPKRDASEPQIVKDLEAIHCRVWRLNRPFDLLVGKWGIFIVLEVKSSDRLRKDQQHQTDEILSCQADGLPVLRVKNSAEAILAVQQVLQDRGRDYGRGTVRTV